MRLLLAVDGSGPSLLAARFVRRLHRHSREMSVIVLHVETPQSDEASRAKATTDACEILDEDDVDYELELVSGDPAALIVERAREHDCDFIVMGARGVGALREAMLGSVSSKVLQNATVPVTIVR